jgi:hypothetical protein
MSRELARQAVMTKVAQLAATWTDYALVVEYPNKNIVDTKVQSLPYLKVRIEYVDGYQVDLATNPLHRQMGFICLEACVKEGSGTAECNKLLQHFFRPMQMTDQMTPVRTFGAKSTGDATKNGWYCEEIMIPMWFDETT